MNVLRFGTPHSERLERWLGPKAEDISGLMRPWYGPPIAVANCPGALYSHAGGDFSGRIGAGRFSSAVDLVAHRMRKAYKRWVRRGGATVYTGFSGFDDLVAEYTAGKRNVWGLNKAGSTGVVSVTNSLWGLGPQPAAGANAANAPGGEAPTDATTGALPFTNPTGGDTQHFLRADIRADFANTLLLYDRIFQVNKTMNSSATESVTGVPTRYQSSTATAADYAGGNFVFAEVGGTALAATAHNWTTCLYRNQAGTDAQTLPSFAGNSSAIVRRLDHPTGQWFAPLATGDTGVMDLNQIQCSAAVATGVINFVIGHPIAWITVPLVNIIIPADGLRGPLALARVFDDAALALLEVTKPATNATTYTGTIETVYG